jgi:hypothetical protein
MMEARGSDRAIGKVARQLRQMHAEGFELGLHLHPQWYNGAYEGGAWRLDYGEYNLCALPRTRIEQIVDRALAYFRNILADPGFTPLAFRAGNWLFHPAKPAADVLAARGIRVDSSVFKGGLQRRQNLDYRKALNNGSYWLFEHDVNVPDPSGGMLELPIYSRMVRPWRLCTAKRASAQISAPQSGAGYLRRFKDYLRLRAPQKLDFCRLDFNELTAMVDMAIAEDEYEGDYSPLVAIGHTKDLVDIGTVDCFLAYLQEKGIEVVTIRQACEKIAQWGLAAYGGEPLARANTIPAEGVR